MRALLLIGLAACSSYAADATFAVMRQADLAAQREPDVELARAALPAGIVQLDAFAHAYPRKRELAAMHAEAECRYAVAFVYDDWEAASLAHRDTAPIAARLNALLERCIADAHVATVDRTNAALALAVAQAMAIRVAIDPLEHLADLPRIESIANRCAEIAPGARDAGAEQLLGMLAMSNGEAALNRARMLAPHALMIDVMLARGVAVARGDRAMFEAALRRVLAADISQWPEQRLANELARVKAARYLAAEATLF